jgi:hypothetical protein
MAFIDWVKNRGKEQSNAPEKPQQKPETIHELTARRDKEDKANIKPMSQLSPDQQARVDEVKTRMEKATSHLQPNASTPAPAPADSNASPQAMRQNMMNQDKAAPDLSPTSAQSGTTTPAKEKETPAPTPEPTPPPKAPSRSPSWER